MKSLLSDSVESILNEAVQQELFASHLYKHLANQLQRIGYFGAQKYFSHESSEELGHYQNIVDYMNDMGTVAVVPSLPAVGNSVITLRDALQIAFDTERELMDRYVDWYSESDPVTQQFLLQFLERQRKSVGEYGDWLARMDRAMEPAEADEPAEFDPCAVLIIDREMGEAVSG